MFYDFTILINLQYNNSKFKELLIDLNIAIRSTSGISQLKILQKIFFMELNKRIIRSKNFIFRIRSILSIDIINLNIFLKIIVFYIIYINILFFLYFANMDKLEVFFK